MAAGMERLASIDRVQDYLVTYDHLERNKTAFHGTDWDSLGTAARLQEARHSIYELLKLDLCRHDLCSESKS